MGTVLFGGTGIGDSDIPFGTGIGDGIGDSDIPFGQEDTLGKVPVRRIGKFGYRMTRDSVSCDALDFGERLRTSTFLRG